MTYLLWIVVVIGLVTLYISLRLQKKRELDKLIVFFLVTVTFHALYVFICDLLLLPRYIETAFPFGLIYGPLFYFSICIMGGKALRMRLFLMHISPFLCWLVIFLVFCFSSEFRAEYEAVYHRVLYVMVSASMLTYVVVAFFLRRQLGTFDSSHKSFRMLTFAMAILATIGLFLLTLSFDKTIPVADPAQVPRMMIYVAMLIQVTVVLRNQVLRLIQDATHSGSLVSENVLTDELKLVGGKKIGLYEKSMVSDLMLDLYEQKLNQLNKNKVFRDVELSLESLAKKINAPKHHLTQLFSVRMDTSFTKYVNGLRVDYACELLKSAEQKFSAEELAYECGFNSKVSFYRNFKNITGMTPSEYRRSLGD